MNIVTEIMPTRLQPLFAALDWNMLNEIRLRANCPVLVSVGGQNRFLTKTGASTKVRNDNELFMVSRAEIDSILHKAANYAVYAVNEQIKQGFLTMKGGIRIGLVGEVVQEHGVVTTIKNVNALNIRIPHQVRGCSYPTLPYVLGDTRPYSTLVIAPPGCGKTTLLRDLSWQISDKYNLLNTLVLDERGEIAAAHLGECQLDVGPFTDVSSGCSKQYGFENGIRSMRPDVIITDEIATAADIEMIRVATRSGVAVIASVHASGIDEIRKKPNFRELIDVGIFERYVVLEGLGKISGIFDERLQFIAG